MAVVLARLVKRAAIVQETAAQDLTLIHPGRQRHQQEHPVITPVAVAVELKPHTATVELAALAVAEPVVDIRQRRLMPQLD